ncbi:MipA/OmpV family protein [Roseovarius sp. S1116L3]|uniref:MipA/OmpV family protein n=1 Tax=Roseovarius roseus TaxID=3342636 RepID=UPI00372C1024
MIEKISGCKAASAALAGLMLLPFPALAQERGAKDGWAFTVTAGLLAAPNFFGDDDYQVVAIPSISATYGERFAISFQGISYDFVSSGPLTIGGRLSYDGGRDQDLDNSFFNIWDSGSDDLAGLGDVDDTIELGGYIGYDWQRYEAKLDLRHAVNGGHDGLRGTAEFKAKGRTTAFGKPLFFTIGPEISFGDDNYNSAYFDVTAAQSLASGISPFDAGGGINAIGIHAGTMTPLTERVSLIGFFGYDRLTGDVASSSIVSERGSEHQGTAGMFISYSF